VYLINLIKVKIIVWKNKPAKLSKRMLIRLRSALYVEKQKLGTGVATGRTITLALLSRNFNLVISLLNLLIKVGWII
jgi:hypothetical protein